MTVRGANYPRQPRDNYPTPPYVTRDLIWFLREEGKRAVEAPVCDPAPGRRKKMVKEFYRLKLRVREVPSRFDFVGDRWPRPARGVSIVTNPPYGGRSGQLSLKFIERALEVTRSWRGCVVMLLPFDFDCGRTRRAVFEHRAFCGKIVLPYRIKWFNNQSGSTEHAWFLWDWENRRAPVIHYMPKEIACET